MTLSNNDIKHFQLSKQGLTSRSDSMGQVLQQVGYVQLDSINIANACSQDLLFRSRVKGYQRNDYLQLYEIDYQEAYLHALSLVDARSELMEQFHVRHAQRLQVEPEKSLTAAFLAAQTGVKMNEQLKLSDKSTHNTSWMLSEQGQAINLLWRAGQLAITRDANFRRIIQLTGQTMANSADKEAAAEHGWVRQLVLLAFRNLGIATYDDVKRYFNLTNKVLRPVFVELLGKRLLQTVATDAITEHFVLTTDLAAVAKQCEQPQLQGCVFLSPFDNLIRERKRLLRLFGFDYKLESYHKKIQRRFGYFAMPILLNSNLIGTIDLKINRQKNCLIVEQLTLLASKHQTQQLDGILLELASFQRFVGADEVVWNGEIKQLS